MPGFVQLDRKILNWEWYKDANVYRVFTHLLIIANYKDGRWQGHKIKRGQTITGRIELAAVLGLSEMQIRTSLNKLKSTKEISIHTTNRFSVITICKYDDYQSKKDYDNQQDNQETNQQITNNQPTDNQQITTNNKDNKENKNKKENNILLQAEKKDFSLFMIYNSSYETYKSHFNGKSAPENIFIEWKSLVDFIYKNDYTEILNARFITPHDYVILKERDGFTEDKWDIVFKKLLSTGIKPEHNLFFRIPDFIEYSQPKKSYNGRSETTKSTASGKYQPKGTGGY